MEPFTVATDVRGAVVADSLDVEEPFGKDGDDLELTRFCETIRKSIEQILGDLELGDAALSTVNVPKLT